jgi:hypothetical protein
VVRLRLPEEAPSVVEWCAESATAHGVGVQLSCSRWSVASYGDTAAIAGGGLPMGGVSRPVCEVIESGLVMVEG